MSYHRGEPYRATRLWLEAVAIFRKEVPLAKHRRQWKSYDECFIASEAITWFTTQLQQKFEQGITRKQTLQLLQKFYKSGIFTSVSSNSSSSSSSATPNSSIIKETDFKDNGHLYRLVGWNPKENAKKSANSSTSESKSNGDMERKISRYNILINQLTNEQVNSIWEQAIVDRLATVIGIDVVRAFFKPQIFRGCWISHNLTQLGKYGVVLPLGQNEDLPCWLVSAMKCLANWPNHHSMDLCPNYSNFERDVFKLIREYFSMYKDGVPLLTFDLYDAFIMTFIRAELFDFNSRLYSAKTRVGSMMNGSSETGQEQNLTSRARFYQQFQLPVTVTPVPNSGGCIREEPYPFNASESVENLIMDILTPAAGRSSNSRLPGRNNCKIVPKRINLDSCPKQKSNSSLKRESAERDLKPMAENSYDISRYVHGDVRATSPFFYETAFTVGSPITRVLSKTELRMQSNIEPLPKPEEKIPIRPTTLSTTLSKTSLNSTSPSVTEDSRGYAYENPNLELSASDMINHPKYLGVLRADIKSLASPSDLCSSYSFEGNGKVVNNTMSNQGFSKNPSGSNMHRNGNLTLPTRLTTRSQSATHLSDMGTDRSPYFPSQSELGIGLRERELESQARALAQATATSRLMTTAGKEMAIASFRLLTLLLPPTSRRHLQLLLRCMSKMSRNEKLKLDSDDGSKSTRAIVINTFFRCIMYCADESEFDELLALRIVTFMMDNDSEIFCIKEEEGIARGVQELISAQQIIKIPVEEAAVLKKAEEPQEVFAQNGEGEIENKENTQFCNRITRDDYEGQRLLQGTSKSLRNLLDDIVLDTKMTDKERAKQLKKFQENYPHIYREKFENDEQHNSFVSESSNNSTAKKPRLPFRIFRNLF